MKHNGLFLFISSPFYKVINENRLTKYHCHCIPVYYSCRSLPYTRRCILQWSVLTCIGTLLTADIIQARPQGVNRADLLPTKFTPVIDLEHFFTKGQFNHLVKKIQDLEKQSGYKLRLLTQRYPYTPGYAIKDYWKLDDRSVVLVADFFGNTGNLLKFNVGKQVDLILPPRYWSLLAAKYGNKFYVEKYGEDWPF
eukprot:jgi/Galph1/1193/GphlegSOOS_G6093.1